MGYFYVCQKDGEKRQISSIILPSQNWKRDHTSRKDTWHMLVLTALVSCKTSQMWSMYDTQRCAVFPRCPVRASCQNNLEDTSLAFPCLKKNKNSSKRSLSKASSKDSNVSFDGQSIFFPGFVKYGFIVAKDWYLFTCCFYTYHVIKKDISFCFFFFFLSLK